VAVGQTGGEADRVEGEAAGAVMANAGSKAAKRQV